MRPDVLGVVEDAAGAVELGARGVRLADEVRVDGLAGQGPRHVGRRHFHEPDVRRVHALVLHELADHEVLVAVLARAGRRCGP